MPAAKRIRWECPNGKHPGVLGSTRPRKDDVVRFCLPCSKEAGRLVPRVAPALDRQRGEAALRTAARATAKRERERAAEQARYVVSAVDASGTAVDVDVLAEVKRCMRLPEVRGAWLAECRRVRGCEPDWIPEVRVRRSKTERYRGAVSGRAWWASWLSITVGQGVALEQLRELILHEVVHTVLPMEARHGPLYRTTLLRAAREMFPGITTKNEGRVYDMDRRIWEEARAIAQKEVAS